MNQQETSRQVSDIEDLDVTHAEAIKGGPKKIFIGGLSAADTPTEPLPQTREHILLARQTV